MSIGTEVAAHLPFLRRYARALTGSQKAGDGLVRATLESALADEETAQLLAGGRVPLYAAFTKLWAQASLGGESDVAPTSEQEAAAQDHLHKVTPLNRQALLLTTVEDFNPAQAAQIIGVEASEVSGLVAEAIAEIERETATSALIIEDEPLISMQLEDLVIALGHDICGTAATHSQAMKVVEQQMPGLVLADIQLADGSSGVDAVDDILAIADVPVIFITAYPERLLTGDRKEPTYLITKPFQEEAVRAAISQALFFSRKQPAG